ncbi:hypothetical protein GCM10009798_42140 [Nocardioides panacihumi]|uniref:Uncharacterized protein n=1 Tax=Nocardioides panacihumi TaxID=400774 RepID=A0ABN2RXB6_9ACTN
MLSLIVDLLQGIYESRDASRLRHAAINGYESAWRLRQQTDDSREDLLLTAIARGGSGAQLQPPYAPDVQAAVDAWNAGLSPQQAGAAIRAASR